MITQHRHQVKVSDIHGWTPNNCNLFAEVQKIKLIISKPPNNFPLQCCQLTDPQNCEERLFYACCTQDNTPLTWVHQDVLQIFIRFLNPKQKFTLIITKRIPTHSQEIGLLRIPIPVILCCRSDEELKLVRSYSKCT